MAFLCRFLVYTGSSLLYTYWIMLIRTISALWVPKSPILNFLPCICILYYQGGLTYSESVWKSTGSGCGYPGPFATRSRSRTTCCPILDCVPNRRRMAPEITRSVRHSVGIVRDSVRRGNTYVPTSQTRSGRYPDWKPITRGDSRLSAK